MPDLNTPAIFRHFMGVLRFGRGLLGRSSNAFISLVVLGGIAIWRLRSEIFIMSIFGIAVIVFFVWYFRVERFANQHPLEALLEGAEYTAHHQMLLAAKGQPNIITDSLQDLGVANTSLMSEPIESETNDA